MLKGTGTGTGSVSVSETKHLHLVVQKNNKGLIPSEKEIKDNGCVNSLKIMYAPCCLCSGGLNI